MAEFEGVRRKTFIVKPQYSAEGRGIYLARKLENINMETSMIAQQYIINPYLIDGLKFDMRIYVLVTSVDPLRIYVCRKGLGRFATTPYQKPDDKNIKNHFMHLTNYSINKHSKDFHYTDDCKKGHKRSLESIWEYIRQRGGNPEEIFKQIKNLVNKTIVSVHPMLKHIYNSVQSEDYTGLMCFDILGFDFILDNNLKSYVLEVNHAPSMNLDTPLDREVK